MAASKNKKNTSKSKKATTGVFTRNVWQKLPTNKLQFWIMLVIVLAVGAYGVKSTFFAHANSTFTATSGRPFADDSAWNRPIGNNPTLDSKSSTTSAYLSSVTNAGVADIYQFGVPIYDGTANTGYKTIKCTEPWGTCKLASNPTPLSASMVPSSGSDAAMSVIDWSTRKTHDVWQYSWNGGSPTTSWGDVGSIDGDGRDSSAVGAGVSRLAGVVRLFELKQGYIDHALVFSSDNSCTNTFRYPATKTDGRSSRADCLPEGARIQLDPSINVDAIPGITSGERMVAKALQKYGAYNIDNGGAKMAYIFETPSGEPDTYASYGFNFDYFGMNHIPWQSLRVLSSWDTGSAPVTTPPAPAPTPTPTPAPPTDTTAPTAPANLVVPTVTSNSVSLTWSASSDNVGVTKYEIWRGDANYANWTLVGTTTSSVRAFTNISLGSSATYTYNIRAYDAAGNKSDASNAVLAKTYAASTVDTTPPAPASGLTATSVSRSTVLLNWRPGSDNVGITRYEVWRGDASYANWALVGSVDGTATSFKDLALSRRTSYVYAIRAYDAANNKSASSNVIKITTSR